MNARKVRPCLMWLFSNRHWKFRQKKHTRLWPEPYQKPHQVSKVISLWLI